MVKNILILFMLIMNLFTFVNGNSLPDSLRQKESIRILITDSGLGGLSVAAYLDEFFRDSGYYKKVDLIFANALYDRNYGYNSMKDRDRKIEVFNAALNGFYTKYHPDMIIVACNTLSVLINETEFDKNNIIPVISIVDYGAELMGNYLKGNNKTSLIILGTETTISEDTHRKKILESDISTDRIFTQACPALESEIQIDPGSDMVQTMIEMYTMDCYDKTGVLENDIGIGLCCTHYPYSSEYFKSIFNDVYEANVQILDPNKYLQSALFFNMGRRFKKTNINTSVISRAEILDSEIQSISLILKEDSEKFAFSLKNYKREINLFVIEGE